MSTFIHLMRGQMSKPLDELGGKCPYLPFLDRGQMSEGEHVRPPKAISFETLYCFHIFKLLPSGTNIELAANEVNDC